MIVILILYIFNIIKILMIPFTCFSMIKIYNDIICHLLLPHNYVDTQTCFSLMYVNSLNTVVFFE